MLFGPRGGSGHRACGWISPCPCGGHAESLWLRDPPVQAGPDWCRALSRSGSEGSTMGNTVLNARTRAAWATGLLAATLAVSALPALPAQAIAGGSPAAGGSY